MEPLGWVVLAAALGVPLLGPFLVPVPALDGLSPARDLADPDSQFIRLNGLDVHLKTRGQGKPVFVLLHGFGASLYSWNKVIEPLAKIGTVIAFDRPAFGLTERPTRWKGPNPYGPQAQVDLLLALLDHFNIDQAVLIGNSAGGTIALQAALKFPERLAGLILVDAAVYAGGGAPAWVRPLLASPQMRHLGRLVARQFQSRGLSLLNTAWHNPELLTPEEVELYKKPLRVENWDRALWELTLASRAANLADRLERVKLPVLVVTGEHDRIVPAEQSIRLAGELPGAQLAVIPDAGHVPHEERPEEFMQAVISFVDTKIK